MTESARLGKERVAVGKAQTAVRTREAASGAERQKREHFRRVMSEAVRAAWSVPTEIARALSEDAINANKKSGWGGGNIARSLPEVGLYKQVTLMQFT
jgi:hypothetical protein